MKHHVIQNPLTINQTSQHHYYIELFLSKGSVSFITGTIGQGFKSTLSIGIHVLLKEAVTNEEIMALGDSISLKSFCP